ncbi:Pimeloyl-ACP methyl ester carboxylesterase [Maribacter dokdonensis]|uniref:Pimeloyl-ACP methyl ester carboxylesterase n=1 Tax=Maribacter dokdonensis TaxID=320912 RepID=A0ABY0UN01_9FLAO|nr:alpha/beta hydrolase [Maribacter dokdonensis]SDS92983.1 Pimeloyl-ACP methyl ester carboxylesterase [Maribacter dokdonensis]
MLQHIKLDNEIFLDVEDQGNGPVIVLLHGWPITSYHWRKNIPELNKAGYRTLAVTLRGLGGKCSLNGNWEKETLSEEVIKLIDILKVKEFAIIGHDWGGTIAYIISMDYSTRIWGLIIEEEILPGVNQNIPEPGKKYYPNWHGTFNRQLGLAESLVPNRESHYYGIFLDASAGPKGIDKDAREIYLKTYKKPEFLSATLGYYRTQEEDIKAISSRNFKIVSFPVLAIGGENAMGIAVKEGLDKIMNNPAQFLVTKHAGHYPAEQTPDIVNKKIIEFLIAAYNSFKEKMEEKKS